jgi:hypothetical protein
MDRRDEWHCAASITLPRHRDHLDRELMFLAERAQQHSMSYPACADEFWSAVMALQQLPIGTEWIKRRLIRSRARRETRAPLSANGPTPAPAAVHRPNNSVHTAHLTDRAAIWAFRMRAMHHARFAMHTMSTISDALALTARISMARSCRPVRLRVLFARHRQGRTGCGVPRVCLASRHSGGSPGNPPFRHYERNARMRQCETEGHRSCATPDGFAKAGSEPINRRGGAPRGERPRRADCESWSVRDARRLASACGPTSLARVRVPLHPSACRRSAPSLCAVRGFGKPRRVICLASTITLGQMP